MISDANKRRIPIHAVAHSELDQDSLPNLETIARRTGGTYRPSPNVDDINKSLTVIKDYVNKMYVIQWKTRLDHDGKDHKVEIAMENEGSSTSLKSSILVRTPDFINWLKIGIITAVILLLVIGGVAIYVLTRPKPLPTRFCPVCKRAQMPEWDVCLFCLKSAKARLIMQKGAGPKGKTWPLVGKVVSLGSGPENSIRILDGAVSGKHAGVAIDGNKFEIVDLGSKNGVLVNGKKTPRRFLRNGDVITLGTAISAFGCCLACVVGAARLVYALSRDTAGPRGLGQSHSRWGTPVWATLAVVVAAVLVLVERQYDRQGVRVQRNLAPSLPPLYGEANALQQVVLNLLMNAIEAMSGNGSAPRHVSIASMPADGRASMRDRPAPPGRRRRSCCAPLVALGVVLLADLVASSSAPAARAGPRQAL